MIWIILLIAVIIGIVEFLAPLQPLEKVPLWRTRVGAVNVAQAAIVLAGGLTWDNWFQSLSLFSFGRDMHPALAGFLAWLMFTFLFYWWHRLRHESLFCWRVFHQLHHSASRIEVITSFYKHPIEILANSLIGATVAYGVLGMSPESGAWLMLYSAMSEFFYHMNIATPRWVGFFIQRPEMHRVHHERGRHCKNYSDLPIWDLMFGTYEKPKTFSGK